MRRQNRFCGCAACHCALRCCCCPLPLPVALVIVSSCLHFPSGFLHPFLFASRSPEIEILVHPPVHVTRITQCLAHTDYLLPPANTSGTAPELLAVASSVWGTCTCNVGVCAMCCDDHPHMTDSQRKLHDALRPVYDADV